MDVNRAYYLAGDLLACAATGSAVSALAGSAIPSEWPIWAAMPLGMLGGMLLAGPCWLMAATWLGVLEPMIQLMLTGMLAGMAAVMVGGPPLSLATLGAACGGAIAVGLAILDATLRLGAGRCR